MASIFTKIVGGEIPCFKVYEDENHLAFLDINPFVEGHTLVIPKNEVDYIFDLDPDQLAAFHLFSQKVAHGMKKVIQCERIGVTVIGLEVPHAHIHLVPISKMGDMNFSKEKIFINAHDMSEIALSIKEAI